MWRKSEKKIETGDQVILNCIESIKRSTEVYNESLALKSVQRTTALLQEDSNASASMEGGCVYFPSLLSMYLENISIVAETMQVLSILTLNDDNARKLGKPTCDLLVAVLKTYISHPDIIKFGCKTLKSMAEIDIFLVHFSRNDVCTALNLILQKYGSSNEMIAEWGCKSIFVLARKSIKNQNLLGNRTCELLVSTILKSEVHRNSNIVKAAVAAAVGALANNNTANKKYFMDSGACWIILKLLELSYLTGPEYATACCYCIANMAENDSNYQFLFQNWSTLGTVFLALKANHSIAHVCVQCLRALRALTHENAELQATLLALNPCQLIVEVLVEHRENGIVAEWGWGFVSSLADYEPFLPPLVAADVFLALKDAFKTYHLSFVSLQCSIVSADL